MSCLDDKKVEELAQRANGGDDASVLKHLAGCAGCRRKLEEARADAVLIRVVRELQERRKRTTPLLEGMADTDPLVDPDTRNSA